MRPARKLIHRLLQCQFLLALLVVTGVTHAGLVTDLIEDYKKFSASVNGSKGPAVASPPSHWKFDVVIEPIFNARILKLETGVKHKQTILLVHGLGQTGHLDWVGLIPSLEKRYHVIALDLPGFGLSEKPEGRYSPTNYAKVLHWLVGRYAKGKAIVIGHSMGGAVALRFAANYPKDISRLILVDAAGILERTAYLKHLVTIPLNTKNYPKPILNAVEGIQDWISSRVEETTHCLTPLICDPTRMLKESNTVWSVVMSDSANANAALSLAEEDFSEAIASLTTDTHIIWGEHDTIAPLRTGKLLNNRLKNSSLYIIKDAEHVPMRSHKQQFNNHLMQFLNNHWQATPEAELGDSCEGDLHCIGDAKQTYRGCYNIVVIDRCEAITLDGISARKLVVKNSTVNIINSQIDSNSIALLATNSAISATNIRLKGKTGIFSIKSHFDLAGLSIQAVERGIKITEKSRLIISISDLASPRYTGFLHGAYNLENSILDDQLSSK